MKRMAALVLIRAGCSSLDPASEPTAGGGEAAFLATHDLAGMEVAEMIDHLDRLGGKERPTDYIASIRPDELVLSDGQQELAEVLIDEELATYANGFAGFWLPRDLQGTIKVNHDGLTGTAEFSTTDEVATCLTTLQLI
ncbi:MULTISPECIES: CueP family metal-binding protein [unclassified Pseudactinotalea]|uniref:CueP family metal-binding protein n=1 Tax=Micrococcales TaxID=85006 RepID=UPI003C7B9E3E